MDKGHFEPKRKFRTSYRAELHRQYSFGGNYYKALERDNHRCTNCGLTNLRHEMLSDGRSLHVHHIDKRGSQVPTDEKNNNLDNLLTLCWSCHVKLDSGNLEKYHGYTIVIEDNKAIKKNTGAFKEQL